MEKFLPDIPSSNNWKTIRAIKEGWSKDLKYYIKDKKGFQFLLRISDGQSYEREHSYYDALSTLKNKNLPIAKLLDSGLCNDGENTYRLFSWIEGVEILKVIDNLSETEQYQYGYEAGIILKAIHQVNSPPDRSSWEDYYNQKIDKKISAYKSCGITFPQSEQVLAYIQSQRRLIENRPERFHHGDFHLGNMLLNPEKKLAVVDFNRLDFGDPWEEFNRITWSASKSKTFATGQIDGYFNNEVPNDFFELMKLYIWVNQIGSISWAITYGKKEVEVILAQIEEVFEWYDPFSESVPNWY